ncbi:MAG: ComF family protein [Firmicutes bacterium]|nr:ComF family protein [Bacillota bacterium]
MQTAWQEVLDALYPPRCAACAQVGYKYWCADCLSRVSYIAPPVCTKCGTPIDPEGFCPSCPTHPLLLEAVRAAAHYEGAVKDAIHRLKYAAKPAVAPALAQLLIQAWHSALSEPLHAAQGVIPIPIHRERERERGFNQSVLLARHFCHAVGLSLWDDVLVRAVYRQPQVGLNAAQRAQNVKDAFRVVRSEEIASKSVLLMDDVWTTGSTLNEAARALLQVGAAHVFALTVAHESLRG